MSSRHDVEPTGDERVTDRITTSSEMARRSDFSDLRHTNCVAVLVILVRVLANVCSERRVHGE